MSDDEDTELEEFEGEYHPEAIRIARAIADYLPEQDIQFGGDGDLGEDIISALTQWIRDGKPEV